MILEAAISAMLAEQERPPLLPKVETFADRAAHEFQAVLMELAESHVTRDPGAYEKAMARMRGYLAGILTIGNLTGRRSMLMAADRIERRAAARADVGITLAAGDVPHVEFAEAIESLVTREPRLASSAGEVARIYSNYHAFALARSTDIKVTLRVQEEVARGLREGFGVTGSRLNIAKILKGLEGYAAAYSETVFRTNAWSSFTAGQFEQAADPDVADVVPAFELIAVGDGDTRPHHEAASGLVAATTDPVWNRFAPPLGYQCRCSINTVDVYTLRRRGLVDASGRVIPYYPPSFSQAHPDPGFGIGRPGMGLPLGV